MGHSLFICDLAYDDTESVGVCSGINNQNVLLSKVINWPLIEIFARSAGNRLFYLRKRFGHYFLPGRVKKKTIKQ